MKKIFVFLLLMVVSFALKAQYPITQNLGSNNTLIRLGSTYSGALKGNLIQGVYADTTEANTGYIDLYPGAIIFSTGNATMYVRNAAADGWIALATGLSAINIYTSDGTLTGNRTLAGVGNSLTFSGLSDFLVEDATGEIKLGTSEFNRLRISSGFTAFISLDADSLLMTRLPQSQLLSTDSVLVRTVDFKVKTRAVSSIGSTYTAGNGLTLSGSQFKLGGTLSENTNIVVDNGFRMGFDLDPSDAIFSVSTNNSDTVLKIVNDNRIYLPQIFTVSSTTGRKVALIDTATGKVERIDPASLVSTPTLQQVLTAGSTLTTNANINAGQNSVTIDSVSYLIIANDYSDGGSPGLHGDFLQLNLIAVDILQLVGGSSSIQIRDSIKLSPQLGQLNIDSLRTWSGISDTTYKKPMTWDTRNGRWEYAANWPQQKISLVFGAGSGADSDTTAFTTSAIYGSFYNDADTIVVTSMRSVLQGTSPDVTYKVWYNDSLNVEAGATALVTAGSQVTNTTTGTNVTSFDATKIPPGVWVWVKTSTVAAKPKYFSLTINGYRK